MVNLTLKIVICSQLEDIHILPAAFLLQRYSWVMAGCFRHVEQCREKKKKIYIYIYIHVKVKVHPTTGH